MELSISDERMKGLMKDAIVEILKEKKEMLYEAMMEAIEDIGLANAISEGRKGKFVREDKILKILEG